MTFSFAIAILLIIFVVCVLVYQHYMSPTRTTVQPYLGWTQWFGQATHPETIAPFDLVEIVRRNGETDARLAAELNWRHNPPSGGPGDIVRFRVVSISPYNRQGKWNDGNDEGQS